MRRFRRCPVVELHCPCGGVVESYVATRFAARLLGLARLEPRPGRALLLPGCRSVHSFGMRAPIDVVVVADLDSHLLVLAVRPGLRPRRVVRGRCDAVLELAAGEAARLGLRPGAEIRVRSRA